jgi:hypothetical protein
VAPAALLQSPPQHSLFTPHTSPFCVQNDPFEQTPPLQSLEQQSSFAVHALPVVRQTGFKGAQTLAVHVPLQHWAEAVQGWLSDVHCDPLQVPASQTIEQQSCGLAHELPPGRQVPPPAPPAPPAPPVPPVDPPSRPPAPPAEMPSASVLPQPVDQTVAATTAMPAIVRRILTLCSFAWDPPELSHSVVALGKRLIAKKKQPQTWKMRRRRAGARKRRRSAARCEGSCRFQAP